MVDTTDYTNQDDTGVDERLGQSAARDFLQNLAAKNENGVDRNFAAFSERPIGFMGALINPETDLPQDEQLRAALRDLNASVRPAEDKEAFSRVSSLPSDKAKDRFKSLAQSKFGVNDVENLTKEQADQIFADEELKAMTERINDDGHYLSQLNGAFAQRDAVQKYDEQRKKNLQTIWKYAEPVMQKKAENVMGVNAQNNTQAPQEIDAEQAQKPIYEAPFTTKVTTNVSVQGGQSQYTYAPEQVAEDKKDAADDLINNGTSIEGDVPQAQMPTFGHDTQNDTTPVMSVRGDEENPNFTYDKDKGEQAEPITVNGNIPNDGTNITINPPSPEQLAQQQKNPNIDFAEGFKGSKEYKDAVKAAADNNKDFSVTGIMNRVAESPDIESAMENLFIGMLLYLPNRITEGFERAAGVKKAKNEYMHAQIEAYDNRIAEAKGMNATDRFNALHKDILQACGKMPEMAAQLRKDHPELLKDLDLQFDENGRVVGELNKKQEAELMSRMLKNNYFETYGHLPDNKTMEKMKADAKQLLQSGMFEALGQQRAAQAEQVAQATAQQAVQQPVQQPAPATPVPATPASVTPAADVQNDVGQAQNVDVENLRVNPNLADMNIGIKNEMQQIDEKPLEIRQPTTLNKAHADSIAVTTPAILSEQVGQYNINMDGFRARQNEVSANRDALRMARMPRSDLNISIRPQQRSAEMGA